MVKKMLKSVIGFFFSMLPVQAALMIVRITHRFWYFIPGGLTLDENAYLGKYKVAVDTANTIEKEMLSGRYDPHTWSVIKRFVRPGNVCIDIGANAGAITLQMVDRCGPAGKVIAFEPLPKNCKRLGENIRRNGLTNVQIVPAGLSDVPGRLKIDESPDMPGDASFLSDKGFRSDGIEVPITTLDDFAEKGEITTVDFIKIDVEGMELEVLRGGKKTIAGCKPVIYYESMEWVNKMRKRDVLLDAGDFLRAMGYRLYRFKGGRMAPVEGNGWEDNTLAVWGDKPHG